MAFTDPHGGHGVRAEINMVPLIDVMLVLLVIFMLTAPLLTRAIRVELPHGGQADSAPPPPHITLSLDAAGTVYWDGEALPGEQLPARLAAFAARHPEGEVRLHADRSVAYARVVELMDAAGQAGLQRVGFVTRPGGQQP